MATGNSYFVLIDCLQYQNRNVLMDVKGEYDDGDKAHLDFERKM